MYSNPNAIVVSTRQRGNPLLNNITGYPWEFGECLPDYVLGETTCALYLSLKYQMLKPQYLLSRLIPLKHMFKTRIVLCYVDMENSETAISEVTKVTFAHDWTMVLAWSLEEAARYLITYRSLEKKSVDLLKGTSKIAPEDHKATFASFLTTIRGLNKTDIANLAQQYGSIAKLSQATMESLSSCPGIGEKKVKRIYYAFRQPIISSQSREARLLTQSTNSTNFSSSSSSSSANPSTLALR